MPQGPYIRYGDGFSLRVRPLGDSSEQAKLDTLSLVKAHDDVLFSIDESTNSVLVHWEFFEEAEELQVHALVAVGVLVPEHEGGLVSLDERGEPIIPVSGYVFSKSRGLRLLGSFAEGKSLRV